MKTCRLVDFFLYGSMALTLGLVFVSVNDARGSVSYSVVNSVYSQNFDSLPNSPENTSLGASPTGWTDDNASPGAGNFSIVGWYLFHPITQTEGGFNSNQRLRIGAGTATTGAFMSWGASTSTERALGSLGSNTMAAQGEGMFYGVRLINDTGVSLNQFTLTYDGEQWRNGGSGVATVLSFDYSTSATVTDWTTASFTAVNALDFTAPVVGTTAGTVDGNAAGSVAGISATVGGFTWDPGTELWLRWTDINDAGADDGMGIDNVSFSAIAAVPEPSSFALFALGLSGLLIRNLRRR